MSVKLISPTGEVDLLQDIAYMARVSNPANQNNEKTSQKLVKYLIKHKHWSPFEMASITMEINTTRDIAHQIVRHRSFAFQEFSQRYAATEFLELLKENSIETEDTLLNQHWMQQQKRVIDTASGAYQWAIEQGIAKEQARAVLPEGLTKTRLYMHGTVRSWIHYIDVRTTPGTQKEHMDIARECAYEINTVFPMIKDFVHE